VQLFRLDGTDLNLQLTWPPDSELAKRLSRTRLPVAISAYGQALASSEFLLVSDVRLHRGLYSGDIAFHSELIAPFRIKDELIGAISLISKAPRHFTNDNGAFAKTLADQAVVAIFHADLV